MLVYLCQQSSGSPRMEDQTARAPTQQAVAVVQIWSTLVASFQADQTDVEHRVLVAESPPAPTVVEDCSFDANQPATRRRHRQEFHCRARPQLRAWAPLRPSPGGHPN